MTNGDSQANFIRVASTADVPPGTVIQVQVGGRSIALCNVGGEFYAVGNRCPHRGGPLGKGMLVDHVLRCPWHAVTFDVRTGACTIRRHSHYSVPTYRVQVVGDDILVEEPAPAAVSTTAS